MKKYVLVTGGQLFNKGAQAMTFIVVDAIAKRFPNLTVIIVSEKDNKRSEQEKGNYKFRIIAPPIIGKVDNILLTQDITRRVCLNIGRNQNLNAFCQILKESACMIDISGYALGSNWGVSSAVYYCNMIGLAKSMHVPVYLFPQSFGPFDFKGARGKYTISVLKRILQYPKVIMARECEGRDDLIDNFMLKNVIKTPDMVLLDRGIDLSNVYKEVPTVKEFDILPSSIGIVPNSQNLKYGNKDEINNLYETMIKKLISQGRHIYLIFHSAEDRALCKDIHKSFSNNENVIFIDYELTFIEFDKIVRKLDYVIASRFHSVVLSYKNNVPAIVLGWATKYKELAESVHQEKYVFDVRKNIENDVIMHALDDINNTYVSQSNIIKNELQNNRNIDLFDYLELE